MKILSACRRDRHIVGARPNFMKAAPIMREMAAKGMAKYPQEFEQILVHTGQHYGNGTLLRQYVEGVFRRPGLASA